jgi:sirohydrochlorin cobaltochelatase
MDEALILFAHGSRDPAWRAPFDRLAERVRRRRPETMVLTAFLEHTLPSLTDAVEHAAAGGAVRIRVAPIFLGVGGHLRNDLPRLIEAARARHPAVKLELTASLGESEDVLDAAADWLARRA